MKVTNGTNTFLWASFLNEKGNKLEDRQNIERIVRGGRLRVRDTQNHFLGAFSCERRVLMSGS